MYVVVVRSPGAARRSVGGWEVTTDPFDALFGPTASRTVETAAVRSDHEVLQPASFALLVFSTGERVVVDRTIVLGRGPRRRDAAPGTADQGSRFVTLAERGVSRRHAVIRVHGSHVCIADLGSANGTLVAAPGGDPLPLPPGRVVDLAPGAVVDLGGEVSFVVEAA